jgi:hypothetical protein
MARLLLAILAAVLLAAPASADPQCNQISPGTRTCVAPGHTSIVTTPNPALMNPSPGWVFGWGTPVIGLGGSGFWLGF